ncbi:MAG: tRNA 2-thiouridine synthesizing protein B [Candidatus Kentron sp. G]|uniref:tRNA 2-thiouridine synthesizing protein B n=1 Tax=Candidatus Kentrum sp. FM TaxID=2126340 RepID=A0A450VLA4_9GAMM|nr:MAG: tRNA 2-thiouridine synthesizing protein B [Candidatus Kentron sp. FM]VFM94872.1 MAG: tRNA 2-thiouridine synthesizing protein B [Candidatus Kentron sp. G]VFJ43533.1 MAG: tRNA 2-thiouridine synthesizing protein B [Candidatus Kentron sp. FM]VFK05568.1 MAG: tRNA 2-thiouridine synthesizing protein B [Candidatus Kentron sp. FM]VFM95391.1 MAG: tRNA 2-thiouridine synthesizing protein B [Candidatus Kentron sp. G]
MSMLHVVNKSPFEKTSLDSCLVYAKERAAILLIEDAVYAALKGTAFAEKVKTALKICKVYALEPDIKARGMDVAKVIDGVELVGYGEFVDLAATYDNVHSWV